MRSLALQRVTYLPERPGLIGRAIIPVPEKKPRVPRRRMGGRVDSPAIEHGIPLPSFVPRCNKRVAFYSWASLGIGDSFFVANAPLADIKRRARAWKQARKSKVVFKCYLSARDGVAGVRVWRIA